MDPGQDRSRHNSSNCSDKQNEIFASMSPDKLEFYKTYDVMTGVRIAATLGGFFSLMVLLVVYKSKCKSRSVSEEDLAAVAAAVVEEEERKESERRMSLYGGGRSQLASARSRPSVVGTGQPFPYHQPLPVGVYARHHSLTPNPPSFASYNQEEESDIPEVWKGVAGKRPSMQHLLRVPSSRRSSRRFSSVTCSSCDSSYLERRGSALEIGHPIPPPFINTSNSDRLDEEPWDYYYPIDIQVIQPTPQVSPCSSQGTLCSVSGVGGMRSPRTIGDGVIMGDTSSIWRSTYLSLSHLQAPALDHHHGHGNHGTSRCGEELVKLAPLAAHDPRSESLHISSLSSLLHNHQHYMSTAVNEGRSSAQQTATATAALSNDQERSLGSDSVFLDEELIDTEDEVDGFSTDSESGSSPILSTRSAQPKIPSRPPLLNPQSILSQFPSTLRNKIETESHNQRRYSSPIALQSTCQPCDNANTMPSNSNHRQHTKSSVTTLAQDVTISPHIKLDKCKKTSSDSDTLLASPSLRNQSANESAKEARSYMSISCDRLVESLQRSHSDLTKETVQHAAWSQETLF